MRYGMVLDSKMGIGCYSCHMAGKAESATPPGVFPARVLEKEDGQYPSVGRTFFPVLCNHC
jgi:Fe-S-cluster-containing dehydrogenase component